MSIKKFILRNRTKISLTLIVVGLLGLSPTVYFRWVQPNLQPSRPGTIAPVNQVISQAPAVEKVVSGHPNRIIIPSLNMSLPVTDGIYDEKTSKWNLSLDQAHYAIISALPNTKLGNTFIYGHYRPEVFARLHRAAIGSEARLQTDNGLTFIYKLESVRETHPKDTEIFAYQGAPQMTIQTCSGAWFQNRQFFTYSLVRYEKSA